MCGIAGVRRYGDTQITPEEVKMLLCSLEHRGNHATGIALLTDGGVEVLKSPTPAWKFTTDKETEAFLEEFLPKSSVALLHTRFATVGNPDNNVNNHPMFAGRCAVVHNGGISNHEFLFKDMKLDRNAETDSDVFRAVLDRTGITEEAIQMMNRFSGSAAIAAVDPETPDLLLLARSGSPLVYGLSDDKLWWASELGAIQRAVRPWVKKHGLYGRKFRTDVAYFTVPDNTAYILTGEGLDLKREFKVCSYYRQPNYNMRATYQSNRDKWDKLSKEVRSKTTNIKDANPFVTASKGQPHKAALCPNTDCGISLFLEVATKWSGRTCSKCHRSLTPLDNLKPEDHTYGNFEKKE